MIGSAVRRGWDRPVVAAAAAVGAYYAFPVDEGGGRLALAVALTLVGVAALSWAIAGVVRRVLRGESEVRLTTLVILVTLSVVVFATGYFMLEQARSDEFVGLETKTDSLYFTMTTLTTVGFGDIFAQGQLARALVVVQMVFNVVFIAGGARLLAGSLRQRAVSVGATGAGRRRESRDDD